MLLILSKYYDKYRELQNAFCIKFADIAPRNFNRLYYGKDGFTYQYNLFFNDSVTLCFTLSRVLDRRM